MKAYKDLSRVVAPAKRSEAGERKVPSQQTDEGLPERSFETLLGDLATLTKNETRVERTEVTFDKYATPTPLLEKALELLAVSLRM